MKKTFLLVLACQALLLNTFGQVIFSSSFSNLTLQTYTTTAGTTQYTTVPAGFSLINDSLKNNTGLVSAPNTPFNAPALKKSGWAVAYNALENDTFLVSTSWLDTTGVAVDRWVVLPSVTNIQENTVLTWLSKSPDSSFPDGFEVYGTTNLNPTINSNFTIGDRLYFIADGNSGAGEKNIWTRHSISLKPYAGLTLRFAFHNNSRDMYQLWIDDIEIKTLPAGLDAGVTSVIADKYVLTNTPNLVKATVTNAGAADITDLAVKYIIGNSSVNTELFSFPTPIAYGQTASVSFALSYPVSSPGYYAIKSWIGSVNNVTDANALNDTATAYVTVQATAPARNLLFEQFVSANNGEGPDAQQRTNAFQSAPVVVVNIHTQDSLQGNGAAALIADYKPPVATALLNRTYLPDINSTLINRPDYGNRLNVEYYKLSPAAISITDTAYNTTTRQLSFTVKANFVGAVKGDYRLNAYLVENNVAGPYSDTTINGYNQFNDYYAISWSPYFHVGYYAPTAGAYVLNALHFKHQNVLIHAFDGAYGLAGIIPVNGHTQDSTYQKTFTYTIPTAAPGVQKFNPDNMYIVGFLAEYSADKNKRTVLNTVKQKLNKKSEFVGIHETAADLSVSVYPNPSTSGLFYLNTRESDNFDLKIFDLFGKCLKTENARKAGTLDLSGLSDGIYFLNLRSGKSVLTEKIVIQKN